MGKGRKKRINIDGPHSPDRESDWSTVLNSATHIIQWMTLYQPLIFLAFLFTHHKVGQKQPPFLKKTNKLAFKPGE